MNISPQEAKTVRFTFWATWILLITVCFLFFLGSYKKDEHSKDLQLQLQILEAEKELVMVKAGKYPEFRPITITDVSSHVLNTSYQNTLVTRWNIVNYSVSINSALTLSGGQTGTIVLQTSPDNSNWTTVCTSVNGNTGTLTIGLNTLNSQTVQLLAACPPGYYYRLSSSGTATMGVVNGREVAF